MAFMARVLVIWLKVWLKARSMGVGCVMLASRTFVGASSSPTALTEYHADNCGWCETVIIMAGVRRPCVMRESMVGTTQLADQCCGHPGSN